MTNIRNLIESLSWQTVTNYAEKEVRVEPHRAGEVIMVIYENETRAREVI